MTATNFLWGTIGSATTLLDSQLNSLAASTLTALGNEINNTGAGIGAYPVGALSLAITNATPNINTVTALQVYLVSSSDLAGTNYSPMTSYTAAGLANYLVGVIYVNQSNAPQYDVIQNVFIPSGKFKACAATVAGSTSFPSSGNTLKLYPTPIQY